MLLVDNGNAVTLWSHREAEAEHLRQSRENSLLKGVALPEALEISSRLDSVVDSELVVLAAPSFAVHEQELEGRGRVAVLSGPSHAEEVGRHIPTGCVAASRDMAAAKLVQDVFMRPRFRVYTNSDVMGVELGAALKNVLALCCGVSDGMGMGDNTKALLMTRGMTEMARLGVALGGRKETFAGLSGMGDLIVTCTSMHSRNRRCGILIGQGKPVKEAIADIGAVVEGYFAAYSAWQLAKKTGVEMPVCESAYAVLYEEKPVEHVLEQLLNRDKKHEVDESWI